MLCGSKICNSLLVSCTKCSIFPQKNSRSRRLQEIGWDDALNKATVGEQVSFLFHAAIDGELSTGRRLNYKPKTQAAADFAKLIDGVQKNNDDGCDHGKEGSRLTEDRQLTKAEISMNNGMSKVNNGKKNNTDAIDATKKLPMSNPVVPKMMRYLSGTVMNSLDDNLDSLGESITAMETILENFDKTIRRIKNAIDKLQWFGNKVESGLSDQYIQSYDVRLLEAAAAAGFPRAIAIVPAPSSVAPKVKVPFVVNIPIVMVAGMVTLLAMLVAGMRQWKKWNTLSSTEADHMFVVDEE